MPVGLALLLYTMRTTQSTLGHCGNKQEDFQSAQNHVLIILVSANSSERDFVSSITVHPLSPHTDLLVSKEGLIPLVSSTAPSALLWTEVHLLPVH